MASVYFRGPRGRLIRQAQAPLRHHVALWGALVLLGLGLVGFLCELVERGGA